MDSSKLSLDKLPSLEGYTPLISMLTYALQMCFAYINQLVLLKEFTYSFIGYPIF